MLRTLIARNQYRDGFGIGYSTGRFAVASMAGADARRATPGGHVAAHWLDLLTAHADEHAQSAGQRPPWLANTVRTPPEQLLTAATGPDVTMRGGSGHRLGDLATFARSVGRADGRTAARLLIVRDLYCQAELHLAGRYLVVDGIPADRWLLRARRRWLTAATRGPTPLPGTRADALFRDMALETNTEATLPHHHDRPPHSAARPAPGTAASGRPAGHTTGHTPPPATPPLRPPGIGR